MDLEKIITGMTVLLLCVVYYILVVFLTILYVLLFRLPMSVIKFLCLSPRSILFVIVLVGIVLMISM